MIPAPFVKLILHLKAVLPAMMCLSQSEYPGKKISLQIPKLIKLLRKKAACLEEDEKRLKASLMLDIVLRGLPVLIKMDQEVRQMIGKSIHARYGIDDIAFVIDFHYDDDGVVQACHHSDFSLDVDVIFSTTEVFLDACEDRVDFFAAVVDGRIVVKGLVPLADRLSIAFEKLKYYLES